MSSSQARPSSRTHAHLQALLKAFEQLNALPDSDTCPVVTGVGEPPQTSAALRRRVLMLLMQCRRALIYSCVLELRCPDGPAAWYMSFLSEELRAATEELQQGIEETWRSADTTIFAAGAKELMQLLSKRLAIYLDVAQRQSALVDAKPAANPTQGAPAFGTGFQFPPRSGAATPRAFGAAAPAFGATAPRAFGAPRPFGAAAPAFGAAFGATTPRAFGAPRPFGAGAADDDDEL